MRWWSGLLIGLLGLVMAQPLRAQGTNQAGLVVVHGNGQIVSRCIDFNEPAISGYDLLQRAGLDLNVEVSGMGAVICRIDGEGCTYPQQSCFCGTEGDSYIYWSYWLLANGGWQYANLGASNQMVQPGMVQGWVWGAGTNNSANPPPLLSFGDLCVASTATPTTTPSATPTPDATATLPASPTALPPTATAPPLPTSEPIASPTWTPLPPATPTATTAWTPMPPPRIVLFAANPLTITAGGTALLLWQVENAHEVRLRSDTGGSDTGGSDTGGSDTGESLIGPVGNLSVQPTQNSVYHLIARNSSGETTATVNLVVSAPRAPVAAPTSLLPTPLPTVPLAAAVAPPLPTATLPPLLPAAEISHTAALMHQTDSAVPALATATMTPTVTPAPVRYVVVTLPPPTTTDPAATRLQLLTVVGGVVLVLVVPLGLLGLAALIWLVKERP